MKFFKQKIFLSLLINSVFVIARNFDKFPPSPTEATLILNQMLKKETNKKMIDKEKLALQILSQSNKNGYLNILRELGLLDQIKKGLS